MKNWMVFVFVFVFFIYLLYQFAIQPSILSFGAMVGVLAFLAFLGGQSRKYRINVAKVINDTALSETGAGFLAPYFNELPINYSLTLSETSEPFLAFRAIRNEKGHPFLGVAWKRSGQAWPSCYIADTDYPPLEDDPAGPLGETPFFQGPSTEYRSVSQLFRLMRSVVLNRPPRNSTFSSRMMRLFMKRGRIRDIMPVDPQPQGDIE